MILVHSVVPVGNCSVGHTHVIRPKDAITSIVSSVAQPSTAVEEALTFSERYNTRSITAQTAGFPIFFAR